MEILFSISVLFTAGLLLFFAFFMLKRLRDQSVHELAPVQSPAEVLQHSHWYQKPFLLILAILLVCPLGVYGLYKHWEINRRRRLQMIY